MADHCPICARILNPEDPDSRGRYGPFCSARCQLVDLHAWLEADYRIDAPLDADAIEDLPIESA